MLGVKWKNVYNMDEKGLQIGGGRKSTGEKYLFGRLDPSKYKSRDANLELVTIIECVSADGVALVPGFVFQGGSSLEVEWLEVDDRIIVSTSPNGWTDDEICLNWFKSTFIPQA
ncbi:hypothetical protein PHLCEN_2v9668 [Hermanssonia centrifuga]|uniref:DDE-1 domain-containing protein n=1 Tax=Hermanssonia centrifuga TaxID=98765 RepID=A0A2R6NQ49_9APHY|nr:hypothetical protein PHLCEN_2v9668 [Hermanssonia centrifuga]